jgi:ATP-dependent DNA helicase RecQ
MTIVFVDIEVNQNNQVVDIGAFDNPRKTFHGNREGFQKFIKGYDILCGHNIFRHDLKYLQKEVQQARIRKFIDTLPVSTLLFAEKPYHPLLKDYKINKDEKNDPFVDAALTHRLFVTLVEQFQKLDLELQTIYYQLLRKTETFGAFFDYMKFKSNTEDLISLIHSRFQNQICTSIDLKPIIKDYPEELAFCLAIINTSNSASLSPEWILYQYRDFLPLMIKLRGTPCHQCEYCNQHFDTRRALKEYFNYENYLLFDGENLQEQCVIDQINGKSIIGVFPTAGGKSLAFQVPALIMAETVKGLTVVISPLQSLMQDQVKNLSEKHVFNVGTINGAMNSIERKNTIDRVREGEIHLLYLAPEMLRSPSVFRLLRRRNIVRFVIDEAHCFSTWGHDFRVDYQYIATFIQKIQQETMNQKSIPVSCFTATAKKEVIDDIVTYFRSKLNLSMKVIQADTRRKNLHFFVHSCKDHHEKMLFIKSLLSGCGEKPVIIYTARRKITEEVAAELNQSGFSATYFHGGMKSERKNTHQLSFTQGKQNIIVATSAFGMGVDKKDVAYVIHYQVSSTIEDYIQEAGRGGRDQTIQAECHILYNEEDIDAHFNLLTSSKLTQSEINQVWKTIKRETKRRDQISISARELAKKSGFDLGSEGDYDTRIPMILLALENVRYIERMENSPRIFATSIVQKTMKEASSKIERIPNLSDETKEHLRSIMSSLYTKKATSPIQGNKPISMIDELVDTLGLEKKVVLECVTLLRENGVLEFDNDLISQRPFEMDEKKSTNAVNKQWQIMRCLIELVSGSKRITYNIKELNEEVKNRISRSDVKSVDLALRFLDELKIMEQKNDSQFAQFRSLTMKAEKNQALSIIDHLADISDFIIQFSYARLNRTEGQENQTINYSLVELKEEYSKEQSLFEKKASVEDIEKALLLIIRSGALIVDGGFLVLYNPMTIKILEKNPQKQYTQQDYQTFFEFYSHKIAKIHILVHFVKSLSEGEEKGLALVADYFNLPDGEFEKKYITKEYRALLEKPMTKTKYDKLTKSLSDRQKEIINDKSGKNIVVLAGPGSGKTTLLVHKLASLVQLEDVKPSELLMLTFSRAATVVFKEKLKKLIGNLANYIAIKTFHSFCFDVIGELGNLEKTESLFEEAIARIKEKEADENIINKTTLVIDEAQDMSESEFNLLETLIEYNEKMRVIAVGDEDQNIYEFRGSNSKYFMKLTQADCNIYELLVNYRSKQNIVHFSQRFAKKLKERYKKNPCLAYQQEEGNVRIYQHANKDFFQPIVEQVKKMQEMGEIAVLTCTNEEAEIMAGLLQKEGINARLIQSNNGFRLTALEEVDSLLRLFKDVDGPITDEIWTANLDHYRSQYRSSLIWENLDELIKGFEILNPDKKYFVDLESYFYEAKMEDFFQSRRNSVTVSTIHKAKGREFDIVFLMNQVSAYRQEDLRAIYVGITRPKNSLIIHTCTDIFDSCIDSSVFVEKDIEEFAKPKELVIQLEHKDINLGRSRFYVRTMQGVSSGTELSIDEKGCLLNDKYVLFFSNKAKTMLEQKKLGGYIPIKAVVQYKVKWYSEELQDSFWIPLPKLTFLFSPESPENDNNSENLPETDNTNFKTDSESSE